MVKVLFVCMGNICRSPTAEGVFTKLLQQRGLNQVIEADSAGTHDYHIGKSPDERARETALRRNIDISHLRARQVAVEDFQEFHYILAMDHENYEILDELCPPAYKHKLKLLMEFAPDMHIREVPDPYYGGMNGFELVFDMLEAAAEGLLKDISEKHI